MRNHEESSVLVRCSVAEKLEIQAKILTPLSVEQTQTPFSPELPLSLTEDQTLSPDLK